MSRVRTWMVELAVVTFVLQCVAAFSGGGGLEAVGAFAVTLTFAHAQVADRMAESEGRRGIDQHTVSCYRWATRYLVSKEVLWCIYFIAHHSWSALAGVGIFLAYPVWRRWWTRRRDRRRADVGTSGITTSQLIDLAHSHVIRPVIEDWSRDG